MSFGTAKALFGEDKDIVATTVDTFNGVSL